MSIFYNIFVMFSRRDFQQTVGISMGTNCAPLLADLFLYLYDANYIHARPSQEKRKEANKILYFHFPLYR
jgi:hypothetical protein